MIANEKPVIIIEDSENNFFMKDEKIDEFPKVSSAKSDFDRIGNSEYCPTIVPQIEPTIVYNEELEKIKNNLDQMSPLYIPGKYLVLSQFFDSSRAEKGYITLSNKEEQCAEYVENFIRQYKLLCTDRKSLLLIPNNEFNVQKFICTYIKPAHFKYSDFYYWDTAAKFISDYLDFIPLLPSTEIPRRILSSSLVLKIRKGTCFEYSNLLCSLLLGVGYDAYVVSGYATRECCYMDQSRSPCPFVDMKEPDKPIIAQRIITKYVVKPPKDLKSKFMLYEEARKIQQEALENEKLRLSQEEEIKIKEKPLPDPLFGLRVHCWVLVKAKSRDVTEDFFIEPLTGRFVQLKTDMFVGVESIWNHLNCWINTQDCSKGINDMYYDISDRYKWEMVLPTELDGEQVEPLYQNNVLFLNRSDKNTEEEIESFNNFLKITESPPSWIKKLKLSLIDYEKKYPHNKKQIIYYKMKCTRYSTYFNLDGLCMELLFYNDTNLTELIEEKEIYNHRIDKLYMKIIKNGWTTEYFLEGSNFNLKEHRYRIDNSQSGSERTLLFYNKHNVDGLIKKEENVSSLIEYYEDRSDYLIFMECTFIKRALSFADKKLPYRDIEKIVKRFSRNYNIPCSDNIKEMIFYFNEERIFITYHVDEFNLIADTREYFKPVILQDGKNIVPFHNDTHYRFIANSICKPDESKLKIYQFLLELLEIEKKSKDSIRWSENQTKDILFQRKLDREENSLTIGLYDTIRNTVANKKRIEIEATAEMERNKRLEDELDYLTPFLYKHNITDIETKEDAFRIREECLMDLKLSLIYKASIIQSNYDEATEKLQRKQQWYSQNQIELNKEDVKEYLNFCAKATFTINNLENLLNRHKQSAPRKYIDLEHKLRYDHRLIKFLNPL